MVWLGRLIGLSLLILFFGLNEASASDTKTKNKKFQEKYQVITSLIKAGEIKKAEAELGNLKPSDTTQEASKHFLNGLLLTKAGKLKEAIAANEKAVAKNPNLLTAVFNIACLYSLQGNKGAAIAQLNRLEAAAKGEKERKRYAALIGSDADLNGVRNEPGFKQVVSKFKGREMKDDKNPELYQKLAKENAGISVADVAFIDQSFRKNGKMNDPAMGSFESLEGVSKIVPHIVIKKNPQYFVVSFGASSWDFSVSIDRKTGAWVSPAVGSVAEEPEPGPGPED